MEHTLRLVHQKSKKKSYIIASDPHMEEFGLYEETENGLKLIQTSDNPLKFDDYIKRH